MFILLIFLKKKLLIKNNILFFHESHFNLMIILFDYILKSMLNIFKIYKLVKKFNQI